MIGSVSNFGYVHHFLDNKPCSQFDFQETTKIGWFSDKINKLESTRDDSSFCNDHFSAEANVNGTFVEALKTKKLESITEKRQTQFIKMKRLFFMQERELERF
jgi:hypothetical protein